MGRFQQDVGASDASSGSGSGSGSEDELHVMDPSDPRAHRRKSPAARPTRAAQPSRWDSDASAADSDVGEPVVITIDDSGDEEEEEGEDYEPIQKEEQREKEKTTDKMPAVKISSWARARFFAAPGERKLPELVEDPPLEPLNDFILSDFGSRFRGATGKVVVEKEIAVDGGAGSDSEGADSGPQVGAPLFASEETETRGKGTRDTRDRVDRAARPARKRPDNRYFITDLATKCFNCGQVGHMSSQCVNDKVFKPCYYCALRGHSSFECPHLPCSSCLQLGHEVWDCSNRQLTLETCEVCGRVGHTDDRCPNASAKALKDVSCMVCTESGHLHCVPVPAPADRRIYCPHCAGNHALRQCRDYVEPDPTPFSRQATRMATKCFRCQEYGHMAAQCTAERSSGGGGGGYSAGNCFKCGRRGHFANDCPSNGSSSGSNSRLSGRKRGRDVDEGDRMYFYADNDDDAVDDGYYHVPGSRSTGSHSRRGNNNGSSKSGGHAELDKALPTYRQFNNGGGRYYSNGDQPRRRR